MLNIVITFQNVESLKNLRKMELQIMQNCLYFNHIYDHPKIWVSKLLTGVGIFLHQI